MKDSTTYRHPRTMQEAFGPYTDNVLDQKGYAHRPMDKQDKIVLWACVLTVLVVVLLALTGVLV